MKIKKIVLTLLLPILLLTSCAQSPNADEKIDTQSVDSCAGERIQLLRVVNAQLDAFNQRNFSKAFALTSDGFKSAFTLPRFTELISTQYSILLNSEKVTPIKCDLLENKAELSVAVVGKSGSSITLIYSLSFEGERWAIDGARAEEELSDPILT